MFARQYIFNCEIIVYALRLHILTIAITDITGTIYFNFATQKKCQSN